MTVPLQLAFCYPKICSHVKNHKSQKGTFGVASLEQFGLLPSIVIWFSTMSFWEGRNSFRRASAFADPWLTRWPNDRSCIHLNPISKVDSNMFFRLAARSHYCLVGLTGRRTNLGWTETWATDPCLPGQHLGLRAEFLIVLVCSSGSKQISKHHTCSLELLLERVIPVNELHKDVDMRTAKWQDMWYVLHG